MNKHITAILEALVLGWSAPAGAGEFADKAAVADAALQGYLFLSTSTEAGVFALLSTDLCTPRRQALTAAFYGYMKREEGRLEEIRLTLVPLFNTPDGPVGKNREDLESLERLQRLLARWSKAKKQRLAAFDTALRLRPSDFLTTALLMPLFYQKIGSVAEAAALYARVRAQRGFLAGYGREVTRQGLRVDLAFAIAKMDDRGGDVRGRMSVSAARAAPGHGVAEYTGR